MPEDSKKNIDKKKHDPKEQRKPRQSRNQGRKPEKAEETKSLPKVPQKPVYMDPGPDFYNNLKRETDEIVKITEAENAKYKKKEIQSNWAKYEMPIESYEDLDEQDVGADYEKLIQAPLTAGGHFQFKHEKTWDTCTAPTFYDKYFDINYENLSMAISSIPFYERNNIDQSEFSETDLLSMNNRASKYKQKYFNDKSYSTPETEAQDRILKSLRDNFSLKDKEKESNETKENKISVEESKVEKLERSDDEYEVNLDFNVSKTDHITAVNSEIINKEVQKYETNNVVDDFDDEFLVNHVPEDKSKKLETKPEGIVDKENGTTHPVIEKSSIDLPNYISNDTVYDNKLTNEVIHTDQTVVPKANPVIESPEDLEKWLDDFLDS